MKSQKELMLTKTKGDTLPVVLNPSLKHFSIKGLGPAR